MLTVTYDRAGCTMSVRGHANSEKAGKDLICAAASILAYTLVKALTENGGPVEWNLEHGNAWVRAGESESARSAMDVIWQGYRLLNEERPDCVQVDCPAETKVGTP